MPLCGIYLFRGPGLGIVDTQCWSGSESKCQRSCRMHRWSRADKRFAHCWLLSLKKIILQLKILLPRFYKLIIGWAVLLFNAIPALFA
jgi:hypothetical protein